MQQPFLPEHEVVAIAAADTYVSDTYLYVLTSGIGN